MLLALLALIVSCVEEIPIESDGFEKAIVIEGSITNELKQHQIKLSQVFEIDSIGPNPLSGATVKVTGTTEYFFEETEPGNYVSVDSFAAQTGINYQLYILANGEEYKSEPLQLPETSSVGQLTSNRINYRGDDGVAITLNNQTSTGAAKFYRYEFTETFKFNANYFKSNDIVIEDGVALEVPKLKEEYTCYRTDESQEIILASTNSLSEDIVNDLLITFIDAKDPKLSLRYSVLVKQYVISSEAYNYYEILKELSGSDNLFSQSQPGFFPSNMTNINNSNENVIGFFEVSSVSTKRTYFNYEDFYDPENIRPRLVPFAACEVTFPSLDLLIEQIENDRVRWFKSPLIPNKPEGSYFVVAKRCVDCTVFGSNEKPEFWED
ncbi:MAG: hypothetical protein ACI83B_002278 [Sediminicola sp.]|jgi:hypothetical protein